MQSAPALFRPLKHTIDAARGTDGRYLLTGSLRETEAFVGRRMERADVLERLFTGGDPELVAKSLAPSRDYAPT